MTLDREPELTAVAREVRDVLWDCLPLADDLLDALTAAERAADSFADIEVPA